MADTGRELNITGFLRVFCAFCRGRGPSTHKLKSAKALLRRLDLFQAVPKTCSPGALSAMTTSV